MQSAYGVPRLPRVSIKQETFRIAMRRLFPDITEAAQKQLWLIVEAAMKQRHGTIIVVSADADKEAARLRQQAMTTEPFELGPELVSRLSNIDGALLVDTNGICHAIGVILDGMATECGDPSRGARYNSALRYVYSRPKLSTLTVIISDDGYVDVFPTFRPQIRRSDVDKYVSLLKTQNIDTYGQTLRWLEEHRFYLNANDCENVNKELARIQAAPLEDLEIRLPVSSFTPNAEMDETYYVEGAEPS